MGVKLKELKVVKEGKQIREMITTPAGTIEVYEPSIDDISKIVDLQREQGFGAETGVVSFDGVSVIRELFPILTNIDMTDSSDEEIQEVIENPSVHLLIAQQLVAQIVAEANKLYAERVKTELMNTESTLAQVELMNAIPALIVEKAKGDGRVSELVEKVEQASKDLEEAMKQESTNVEVANESQI